jgi:Cu-Zn family superoxide dismutase
MHKLLRYAVISLCFTAFVTKVYAADITVPVYFTSKTGTGKAIGTVAFADTKYGLLITPNLTDLTPGLHGFHIHVNPSCADAGMAAGGHLDPQKTGVHAGPYSDMGHLGDLPALYVNSDGDATLPVLAPRLKTADIENHSLMIHAGGDNYSDNPPLGGGGARIACGVIK